MISRKMIGAFLGAVIVGATSGQVITNATPAVIGFVDISTIGGTAVPSIGDDTEHTFTTTLGNAMFPAGPVRIGTNGALGSGISTGEVGLGNVAIPATGVPTGMPAGAASYICAFWDDLDVPTAGSSTTLYWLETSGILFIMWKDVWHFGDVPGQQITFEIQIFSAPGGGPWIQIVYPDTVFGGTQTAFDAGGNATVGWIKGTAPLGSGNAQWSFNTPSVPSGTTLSFYPPMTLGVTAPFGPGTLQVDIGNGPPSGTYFLCVTLNQGNFPNGWLFGIAPSFQEMLSQANQGFPFVGPLDAGGSLALGPIFGVPSGFTLYLVSIGFDTPVLDVPSQISNPLAFTTL